MPSTKAGDQQTLDVRRLRRDPHGVFFGRREILHDAAARFHRRRDQALIDQRLLNDYIGLTQRLIDRALIAACPFHDDVIGRILVKLRRARFGGFFGIDHHRQRLIIDFDQPHRILSNIAVLSDDHRHTRASESHFVAFQHVRRVDVVLDAARLPGTRQRRNTREILPREHTDHAGNSLRRVGIDRLDPRMSVRTAQNSRVGHAQQLNIINIFGLTCDQAWVFAALNWRTNHTHISLRPSSRRRSAPPRRYSGSRCSGTDCPPNHDESRPRSGADCPSAAPPTP